MSIPFDNVNRISILQDGNCFFRCLSTFVNKKLLNAERFKNGRIKNKTLAKCETDNSISLRKFICSFVEKNKEKYKNAIYYDDEMYSSIDDRIENMNNIGEFAGLVEIKEAAKSFRMCINIFVCRENETYNLISKIGKDDHKHCYLVLDNNHYELLETDFDILKAPPKNKEKSVKKNKKKDYGKSDRVLRNKKRIDYSK